MSYLEVRNITKSFNKQKVLKNISFSMEEQEIIVILGESGCGKTTLLRILNGLEKYDEGEIIIDKEEGRQSFGLVFQSFNLFPHYNVLSNVTLAKKQENKRNKTSIPISRLEDDAREILKDLSLLEKEAAYPFQLSGGQQQRLAIARALILKPQVLCFDEPTSALDPNLSQSVCDTIIKLRNSGQTIIVVTHDLEFAKQIADKIIFISSGEIMEMGDKKTILSNPVSEQFKIFMQNYRNIE